MKISAFLERLAVDPKPRSLSSQREGYLAIDHTLVKECPPAILRGFLIMQAPEEGFCLPFA